MEMHQIRYFLAVCRTLNFTKAAEECNVAQPSLTRAVQKLEEELGGLLFHRERANTHLTELGRLMQPHLEKTYETAQAAKALALGIRKGEVSPLRVGMANSVPGRVLSDVIRGVREGVPGVELSFGTGAEPTIIDAALAGDFDLVILGSECDLPERLRSWALFKEPLQVLLPEGDPLASQKVLALNDLQGRDFVERAKCPGSHRFRDLCMAANVSINFRHSGESEDQIQNLVRAGYGIALVPESVTVLDGLITRPVTGIALDRSVALGAVTGRRYSTAADAFIKLARSREWSRSSEAAT
jgi:DNA-binding transcriptional LysR family regulator